MKILIVGAGRAGLEVASQLSRIGHAVTIVDTDAAVVRRAAEQYGLVAITGDATTAEVLDDAAIGRMDIVMAMLRRDAERKADADPTTSVGARERLGALADGPAHCSVPGGRHRAGERAAAGH